MKKLGRLVMFGSEYQVVNATMPSSDKDMALPRAMVNLAITKELASELDMPMKKKGGLK